MLWFEGRDNDSVITSLSRRQNLYQGLYIGSKEHTRELLYSGSMTITIGSGAYGDVTMRKAFCMSVDKVFKFKGLNVLGDALPLGPHSDDVERYVPVSPKRYLHS